MQDAAQFRLGTFFVKERSRTSTATFVVALLLSVCAAAAFASWLPLQVSVVTVFLFAGPHNWFELRYFLMRLPVRFGNSRRFFTAAFVGLAFLTISYVSLPFISGAISSSETWLIVIASWNTLFILWLVLLVSLRANQKPRSDWSWTFPAALALCALNWLAPEMFSLGLVYVHPLIALWFLDRHLKRNRPEWLAAYRRSLAAIPILIVLMIWRLSQTSSLAEDNGLFWRITQHSGAHLLPNVSSHLLVSIHLFLEMLHYAVWILVLPFLISKNSWRRFWDPKSIPVARHPRGFRKTTAIVLGVSASVVVTLWLGFSIDYSTTRDLYFTVAMAHVLAEAPFLLKMI